jgi:flagellar motor switch protein FliM
MEKVLNQGEIDAMVRAARSGKTSNAARVVQPVVQPWDIRQSGQIGREQLSAINQLHELFARNLTTSLGGFLRVVFDCCLVSAEHLTYREFLQRVPEKTYLASCDLAPFGSLAVLQFDLGIGFPVIDIMLGGEGKSSEIDRDLTEIEEEILEGIVRIICRDLQTSWLAIHLEFSFGACHQISQVHRLMPPDKKNLCLSFELKLSESTGSLNVAVPALVSNALLRKISADNNYQRPRSRHESRDQIRKKVLDCPFTICLAMSHLEVPLEGLSRLVPGDVLQFKRSASVPAVLEVDGVALATATPVRVHNRRAARVLALEPQAISAGEL